MSPLPPRLYLLAPWELPTQVSLSDAHQRQLSQALTQLLRSLEQPTNEAIATLDQALSTLDSGEITAVMSTSTKTPLKPWEVEDFDQYFGVTHIHAQEPTICLVMSLLLTCRTFLVLIQQGNEFDQTQVDYQKHGFASYARLLARVFNIRLEKA
jgi:hypothetical protein